MTPTECRIASTKQLQEIMQAADLLKNGIEALNTIGLMLAPETDEGDEPVIQANRSDMAALFKFFGEVLHTPATHIYETADIIDIRGLKA